MWNKFTEGFWEHFDKVLLALLFVFVAGSFYNLGSDIAKNKVCDQIGGVYVKTYIGYKCLHITEITL